MSVEKPKQKFLPCLLMKSRNYSDLLSSIMMSY